jgi:hypothetical protein
MCFITFSDLEHISYLHPQIQRFTQDNFGKHCSQSGNVAKTQLCQITKLMRLSISNMHQSVHRNA